MQTSLLEAMIAMLDFQAARWTVDGEVPAAGGQPPPDGGAHGLLRHGRRLREHRRAGGRLLRAFCEVDRAAGPARRPAASPSPGRVRQPGASQRPHRRAAAHPHHRRVGERAATRRACPAGPSTGSTRCSPTPRSSTSTWWLRSSTRRSGRCDLLRNAVRMTGTAAHRARAPAPSRRAHRRRARRARLRRPRDRRPARTRSGVRERRWAYRHRDRRRCCATCRRWRRHRHLQPPGEAQRAVDGDAAARARGRCGASTTDPEVRVVVRAPAPATAPSCPAPTSPSSASGAPRRRPAPGTTERRPPRPGLGGLTKPVIAMIRGYCIGGGMLTALQADIRVAAEDAQFGVPAAKLGLGYGMGGVEALAALVGPAWTAEILFSARRLRRRRGAAHRPGQPGRPGRRARRRRSPTSPVRSPPTRR